MPARHKRAAKPLGPKRGPSAGRIIKRIPLMGPSGHLKREYYAFWPMRRGNWAVKEFARMPKGLFD